LVVAKSAIRFVMSVRLSLCFRSAATGRIFGQFDIGAFCDKLFRKSKCGSIGQEYRALYMNTSMRFIVAGDIILLQQRSLRVRWYQAVRIAEEVQTS
jgi:hypothetical protein